MATTPSEAPLDPTALARFGRLELIARLVVEGVMSGLHKSPFKGFSVEFAEHRQYGPGDEILARLDDDRPGPARPPSTPYRSAFPGTFQRRAPR